MEPSARPLKGGEGQLAGEGVGNLRSEHYNQVTCVFRISYLLDFICFFATNKGRIRKK